MTENQPNELTLIFHSEKAEDKKARVFIETVSKYKVKILDLKRESLTETQIAGIAIKMEVPVRKLIDNSYRGQMPFNGQEELDDIEEEDLLIVMSHEPIIINTPIVII